METIVHTIRLHPGTDPEDFERWVREVDYATCPELPSVRGFHVFRISTRDDEPAHYAEIIEVTDHKAFARDMETPAFARLVAAFEQMAAVLDTLAGERVGDGYRA
ncbi:RedY protein [Streptomyces caeni]|uniref:RedY protein n=1 Tax=Streptomyces caeni TaxID=2307231 RepID=A0ABW4IUQ0_9ACTN